MQTLWPSYNIIDISRPIKEGMPVYPGSPEVVIREDKGDTSTSSFLSFGSHTGTHIDAPRHVFEMGIGVGDLSLTTLIGPCKVLDFSDVKSAVTVEHLQRHSIHRGERILLKTANSFEPFDVFNENYAYLDGDAADFLAELEIALIGIDYLSIKQYKGNDYRAHDSLLIKNIPIIEGLDLSKAHEGNYILLALPLPFGSIDGSPIRAVLLE